MPEMRYTVDEIDALREATLQRYGLHSSLQVRELEERVRTFMLAGLTAKEIKRNG